MTLNANLNSQRPAALRRTFVHNDVTGTYSSFFSSVFLVMISLYLFKKVVRGRSHVTRRLTTPNIFMFLIPTAEVKVIQLLTMQLHQFLHTLNR